MRQRLQFALLISAVLVGVQAISVRAAQAESRVALVIGQSAYRAVTALPNPANDAKQMSQMLTDAGFDVVSASDLSQKDMRETVSTFAGKVAAKGPDTIALVFYAGHGLQIDGENFLVPVDIDPKREADIPLQAVRLNDVLNTLASVPSKMRILLLDACRNNPFPELAKTAGHGFAIVDAKTSASGTFISYSTSPGAEAEDGRGVNSPYTTALLKAAREPGLSIEETFKRVRVAVNQDTGGRQTPWDSSSLTDAFRFFPQPGQSEARVSTPKRSIETWKKQLQGKTPQAAYDLVIADDSVEAYAAFVAVVAAPPYAPRVRGLLTRRREMVAWQGATFVNTEASYRGFLLSHPDSDLAATARKLEERQRTRALNIDLAGVGPGGPICPCGQPGTTPTLPRDDTPRRERPRPPRRAEAPPPPRPLPYTEVQSLPWSSSRCYAGVSGGYVRQPGSSTSITPNDADLLLSQQLGNVPTSLSSNGSGGIVGGQFGCDTKVGNLLFGIETDLSYNSVSRTAAVTLGGFDVTTSFHQEMQAFGTLRGRVGVAAGSTLFYATAGLAYGNVRASASIVPGPTGIALGGSQLAGAQDNWRVGWTVGAGIEQMISQNWSIKSEYLYYDLGETSFTAVTYAGTPYETGNFKYNTTGHIIRAGLNFHF